MNLSPKRVERRYSKFLFWLSGLILIGLIFVFLSVKILTKETKSSTSSSLNNATLDPVVAVQKITTPISSKDSASSNEQQSFILPRRLKSYEDVYDELVEKGANSFSQVFDHPEQMISKAKAGDGMAAYALYKAAWANCAKDSDPSGGYQFDTSRPHHDAEFHKHCTALTLRLQKDAKQWLEIAAQSGDLRALMQYSHTIKSNDFLKNPSGTLSTDDLAYNQKAVGYLIVAAQKGIANAYTGLYQIYSSDTYGLQDKPRAHAYLAAMVQIDPNTPYKELFDKNEKQLNAMEKIRAAELTPDIVASCCK
jgi:hypothetical protein